MTVNRSLRPILRILAVALLAALAVPMAVRPAAAADATAEAEFLRLANAARSAAGVRPLTMTSDLVAAARAHSVVMADQVKLHHNPELATDVTNWRKVGENVGRGPSVRAIHDALMASEGHRRNLLDPDYTDVGMGVEVRDGRVWVTQVFRQPLRVTQTAPAPAPEPTPEPTPTRTAAPRAIRPAIPVGIDHAAALRVRVPTLYRRASSWALAAFALR